jgi:hypothetical protein
VISETNGQLKATIVQEGGSLELGDKGINTAITIQSTTSIRMTLSGTEE